METGRYTKFVRIDTRRNIDQQCGDLDSKSANTYKSRTLKNGVHKERTHSSNSIIGPETEVNSRSKARMINMRTATVSV